ncbi:Retrovirus-related Pol polyprotein from transposon RE1 [Vitis vinifera]|uniref:Retrovirus-related Pol polyprotein from transposon RE1 n=1 Tax=Vitis vinifera TaxID=29760 RepID=A0A438K535_VITVI|nr:Retrovirus-related Pol polyprotein from transposon RE1 [Vitis vinifera]
MATKSSTFSSVISGSPMITSEKLVNSENYLSWSASVELWFMGQGYEDHLVTQEADIPEIASLKEEFLTMMPLTTDVGDQRIQIDKFFMVLTLIGLRPDLETVRDQILSSSSVPSLDDVFARLLRISSTQILPSDNTSDSSVLLHGRPPRTTHVAQSSDPQSPQPSSSSTSQGISLTDSEYDDYLRYQATKSASVASVAQTGNASACLTHTSSLGPWILDSGASDHISGNKDLFSSITTTSALPTVTLANGSQTMAKGPEYGEDDWHRTHLGHPSLSKFQKMVPSFSSLSSLVCESCQLGKHTHVSFPKRLNNQAKSPFELVHTDDKLSARATKCIFLGYSRLQKGYHCYSSETHRYFLSADVTFFEDSPFFSTSKSLPVSEVYHRRHRVAIPPSLAEVPADSLPIPSASPAPALPPSADLPIALRKGKSTVGCRWVYTVKVGPNSQVDRLKARLVAKGYTQVYGSDYGDTFSPVAKIASVRLLLSMAAMRFWPLYQLDIKMLSFMGILLRKFIWSNHLVLLLRGSLEFGMFRSTADHSVFYHHNSSGQCIYLVVYVDDIIITGNDQNGIQKLKQHLFTHFQTKDLGKLNYFLGIEIAQFSSGVVLSQRKYALDILEETGMLDCKPVDTPMDPNVKLIPGQGEPLGDPGRYRRRVGKLNYLTITRPDISFPVSVVNQFLQSPCDSHWDVVIRILRYIKSTPGQGVLYQNRGHAQSKKQDVVVRSSAEAKYRAMALATCELIWLKHLLRELKFGKDEQMKLICDN